MGVGLEWPWLWAQSTSAGGVSGAGASAGSSLLLTILALRRWCSSLTLSTPDPAPGLLSMGLWAWLGGMAALLVVAGTIQGPGRTLAQLLDLPGHARLLGESAARLRRAGRMIAIIVGLTVVSWTAGQAAGYGRQQGRDDLVLLLRGSSPLDVGIGQAFGAALSPVRDLQLIGMMAIALFVASVVLFRFSNDRWGAGVRPPREVRAQAARWSTIGWTGAALYAFYYRLIGFLAGQGGLPSGGCLVFEVVLVPALMTLGSGLALAWILGELRGVPVDGSGEGNDALGMVLLIPGAVFASAACYPAALVGVFTLLISSYATVGTPAGTALDPFYRWVLGSGLIQLQAASLLGVGLIGSVAWSQGGPREVLSGYARLLAAEGGRVVAAVGVAGLAAGAASALAYAVLLGLPASTWVLGAADSYAHYATLPIGLFLASALVELGERSLPVALPAERAVSAAKSAGDPLERIEV